MTSASLAEVLALALDAKAAALDAGAKADRAIERCERTEASVADLGHVVTRCTNEVLAVKRAQTEHHTETLAAIEGAKLADRTHAQQLADLRGRLTGLDIAKVTLAGGGGSAVVALVLGMLALLLGRPLPAPAQTQPYAPTTVYVTPPAPAPGTTP